MMRRLALLFIVPLFACGSDPGGAPSGDAVRLPMGQSRLALEIAVQPDDSMSAGKGKPAQVLAGLSEIIVDIDEVTAHSSEAGWVVLLREPKRVDILKLAESAVELGFADLPPGRISQIRLHVAEDSNPYVTLESGGTAPLKVPSGMQSGIKLKGLWDLEACQVTRVQARFDRRNSIHVIKTGHDEQHILRPVIFASGSNYEDAICGEPPGDGTTPPGDGTTPPGDGTTPPGDGTTPPTDGTPDPGSTPPDDGTTPPGDGTTPPDDGTPPGDGTTPPDDGTTPPGDGTTPPGDGTTPPTGSDPNAPQDPTSGLCDSGETCAAGYYCGQTGVCIPSF